jgi:hypothetical protein
MAPMSTRSSPAAGVAGDTASRTPTSSAAHVVDGGRRRVTEQDMTGGAAIIAALPRRAMSRVVKECLEDVCTPTVGMTLDR